MGRDIILPHSIKDHKDSRIIRGIWMIWRLRIR